METCAQAIAVVNGVPSSVSVYNDIPVTTGDCQIGTNSPGQLFELWGSSVVPCPAGLNVGSWKNTLDLSYESDWCDGAANDYKYRNIFPDMSNGQPYTSYGTVQCPNSLDTSSPNHNWNRSGYVKDTTNPGQGQLSDFQWWIANGFQGSVRSNASTGNYLPTTCDSTMGSCANWGDNISVAFYCNVGTISGDTCTSSKMSTARTYFFKASTLTYPCEGPQGFTTPAVGCRMGSVITWSNAQWATGLGAGGTGWTTNSSGGGPDRVMATRVLSMRLFCQMNGGNCTQPPSVITGSSANSNVWGLFVSVALTQCPAGQTCTGGPSVTGNVVSFGG